MHLSFLLLTLYLPHSWTFSRITTLMCLRNMVVNSDS
jgi:hypothetical protein